ncbi:MAG: hypothetical protein WCB04_14950 [Mycobacteriales bacterium]
MRKLTFALGFGAGYLFGTKAGRARYEQILRSVREVRDNPAVQETAGVVQAQAADLLSTAKDKVGEALANTSVGQKLNSAVGRDPGARLVGVPRSSAGSNGYVR